MIGDIRQIRIHGSLASGECVVEFRDADGQRWIQTDAKVCESSQLPLPQESMDMVLSVCETRGSFSHDPLPERATRRLGSILPIRSPRNRERADIEKRDEKIRSMRTSGASPAEIALQMDISIRKVLRITGEQP